jgi:hypothetical protein
MLPEGKNFIMWCPDPILEIASVIIIVTLAFVIKNIEAHYPTPIFHQTRPPQKLH